MAEDPNSGQDKTEEATPERREDFRNRGQIAVSREVTSIAVLCGAIGFLSFQVPLLISGFSEIFNMTLNQMRSPNFSQATILSFSNRIWYQFLVAIIPIFCVTFVVSTAATFFQTRFNWSWKRLAPDFQRMNPLKGLIRMVNLQALLELGKGIAKMSAVGGVSYLILYGEWQQVPGLMNISVQEAWAYWGEITRQLFWGVSALLLAVAAVDYIYNFMRMEREMKMTRQDVKEELKKRETDPQVKARIRRLQREIVQRKMLTATQSATAIITNPTHYSVAIKYEFGMREPMVVAKGIDFMAQRIREVAKESEVPIIENPPLARTLYKTVEVGHGIPEALYKAVAEIIRYVFKLKGKKLDQR